MCLNGTRNDRRRATESRRGKFFSGKERAQEKPNLVEFASRFESRVTRKRAESTVGGFFVRAAPAVWGNRLACGTSLSERFEEYPFEKHADQVAFVFGAAFEIVDGIGGLRQRFGGGGELILNLRLRAGEQSVGFVRLRRHRADAADHRRGFLDRVAIEIQD